MNAIEDKRKNLRSFGVRRPGAAFHRRIPLKASEKAAPGRRTLKLREFLRLFSLTEQYRTWLQKASENGYKKYGLVESIS